MRDMDHLISMQSSVGKPWVLALCGSYFVLCTLTDTTHVNIAADQATQYWTGSFSFAATFKIRYSVTCVPLASVLIHILSSIPTFLEIRF